jgi:hypothetical protein
VGEHRHPPEGYDPDPWILDARQVRRARELLGLTCEGLGMRLLLQPANAYTHVKDMESGRREITGPISAAIRLMVSEAGLSAQVLGNPLVGIADPAAVRNFRPRPRDKKMPANPRREFGGP